MDNHYHLLMETIHANLSRGMRQLNGVYTQNFNRHHGKVGHILQGRFKAILVEKDAYLLEVSRYIVLNPVRAYIVKTPGEWKWSNYPATAGHHKAPKFLATTWILSQFHDDMRNAQKRYQEFVSEGKPEKTPWLHLKGQIFLGRDAFIEKTRKLIEHKETLQEIPRQSRVIGRPGLREIFHDSPHRKERNRRIVTAHETHEYTLKEIGDHLGLHYSTVSRLKTGEREKTSKSKT